MAAVEAPVRDYRREKPVGEEAFAVFAQLYHYDPKPLEPVVDSVEESLYWRGRAYYMAGKTDLAVKDYRDALKVHPKWIPATQALQDLGLQP